MHPVHGKIIIGQIENLTSEIEQTQDGIDHTCEPDDISELTDRMAELESRLDSYTPDNFIYDASADTNELP